MACVPDSLLPHFRILLLVNCSIIAWFDLKLDVTCLSHCGSHFGLLCFISIFLSQRYFHWHLLSKSFQVEPSTRGWSVPSKFMNRSQRIVESPISQTFEKDRAHHFAALNLHYIPVVSDRVSVIHVHYSI